MNSKMYSQTDPRWKNLPYPGKGYKVGGSGCGLCAVTHLLIEQPRYKNKTPKDFQPYMRKYATYGHGTEWNGITQGLKHYGHKKVTVINCLNNKGPVYKEFNKGNRMAVALFSAKYKTPDGTQWTKVGHYISFMDYKVVNGKHYFYVKDSGGKARRGWYCVEKSMGKSLKMVWIVERLDAPTPAPKYTPKKIKVDGVWGSDTTKLTQHILKVSVDGVISSQPKKNKKYLPGASETSWKFVDDAKGSVTVKAIQKLVGAVQDGIMGPKTVTALQEFLKLKVIDGEMGKVTVKAWQEYLNKEVK